jgi:hypothetical protein
MEAPERARESSTSFMMNGAGLMATSSQARPRRKRDHKLRVQASSLSLQAREPGNRDRVGSPQASGHKQPGQKYFFYA